MATRIVIPQAVQLIRRTEVLKIDPDGICRPYQGKADKKGVLTIGIGHVIGCGGEWMHKGITREQAEDLFAKDIARHSEFIQADVNAPMDDWEYGAFASFAFNLGPRIFATASLAKQFREGMKELAICRMHEFSNSDGQYRDGLFYRRLTEITLALMHKLVKKPDNCTEARKLMNDLLDAGHRPIRAAMDFFERKHRKDLCPACKQRK